MKIKTTPLVTALALLALSTLNPQLSTCRAQGTAFTYQGRLNGGGSPLNGLYDFRFKLFADPLGNTQVGANYFSTNIPVAGGLFVTTIDFGAGLFNGSNYWLEVDVRTNNPPNTANYTQLTPFQALTPTPYAVFANTASNVSGTISAAQINGVVANVNLPSSPTVSGTVTAGFFAGNGANVTNVNAAALNGLNATNFWRLGGNAVAPGQFLGSTNNLPVELWANGSRAFRLEPNPGGAPNVIGGSPVNYVAGGVTGATIAGGGQNGSTNRITGSGGFVGGGFNNAVSNFNGVVSGGANNTVAGNASGIGSGSENDVEGDHSVIASGQANLIQANADHSVIGGGGNNLIVGSYLLSVYATIGGGQFNIIATNSNYSSIGGGYGNTNNSGYATIGGGYANNVSGLYATLGGGQNNANYANSGTIGGGLNNQVSGIYSTISGGNANSVSGPLGSIGGGANNQASGTYATVPGGIQNIAGGSASFAAGSQAQATNQGAFVWADSQGSPFASTANNQFLVRAQGGVGINMNNPNGASLYVQGDRTNNWPNSMSFFENTETGTNASPALRVVSDAANTPAGALSVSVQGNGLIAQFGNGGGFVSQLDANGNWTASSFTGGGGGLTGLNAASLTGAVPSSSLTSVPAASLTGTVPLAQLPGAVVTNTETGVTLTGTFSGDGSGLKNLVAATPSGSENTAIGYQALQITTGSGNTGVGHQALFDNRTGFNNTAIGDDALNLLGVYNAAGGSNNIALGYLAGSGLIANESGNIDIGNQGVQLENNTIRIGSSQTATYLAGVINGNGGGLTNLNVSTMQLAGGANGNVFVGPAGNSTTSGANNAGIGAQAIASMGSGSANTAIGASALQVNSTGFNNTAIGAGALLHDTAGWQNTAMGSGALANLGFSGAAGGSNNIALGYLAGSSINTGSSNIDIGNAGGNENNTIRIGDVQTATYLAGVINGNGGGLTNLNAARLSGSVPSAALTSVPAANLTGALPAISGASLTSLPANAALLGASQSFTGGNTFTSTTTITNAGGANSLNVYGTQTGGWGEPGVVVRK
jgi:hypothetical protein